MRMSSIHEKKYAISLDSLQIGLAYDQSSLSRDKRLSFLSLSSSIDMPHLMMAADVKSTCFMVVFCLF